MTSTSAILTVMFDRHHEETRFRQLCLLVIGQHSQAIPKAGGLCDEKRTPPSGSAPPAIAPPILLLGITLYVARPILRCTATHRRLCGQSPARPPARPPQHTLPPHSTVPLLRKQGCESAFNLVPLASYLAEIPQNCWHADASRSSFFQHRSRVSYFCTTLQGPFCHLQKGVA